MPFISGERSREWRDGLYIEHRIVNNPELALTYGYRDDTWKYIRYDREPTLIELYNHKEDVDETVNLALLPEYVDKMAYYQNICDSIIEKLEADRVH